MNDTTFETLPPDSRVWVFAADREMSDDEETRLRALVDKVAGVWSTKAEKVRGCYEIRDRRFLLVGANESAERLSGCSIDAMMAWVMRLEAEAGLRLLDRMTVHWRDAAGVVRSATRAEFRRLLDSGAVGPETRVFDTTVSRVEALRAGRFELPLRDSWHAQLFLAPRAAAT